MIARKRAEGFTLIEMLIVLVILGVVSTLSVISFQGLTGSRRALLVSEQLQRVVLSAAEQAVLVPEVLGLKIGNQGYQFYRYTEDSKGVHWQPLMHDTLSRPKVFTENGVLVHFINNLNPMIVFSDSGDVTPFTIRLTDSKREIHYQLRMSDLDVLTLKRVNP